MKKYHHHRVGAPLGNRNARKHGFYSRILTADQQAQLPRLAAARCLEHEIEVLRVKLYSIQAHAPDNTPLQFRVARLLTRMVNAQEKLDRRAGKSIRAVVRKYMPGENYGTGCPGRPPVSRTKLASNCFACLASQLPQLASN
jgi:hypothetical protein